VVEDVESFRGELLNVVTTSQGTETSIVIDGELDAGGSEWFGACVRTVLEKRPGLMAIDARGVTFLDSSGLRSLLLARAAADDAGVAFRIDDPSPELRRFIERTGLRAFLLNG
jgi:anti-sigma B factor antagonist